MGSVRRLCDKPFTERIHVVALQQPVRMRCQAQTPGPGGVGHLSRIASQRVFHLHKQLLFT